MVGMSDNDLFEKLDEALEAEKNDGKTEFVDFWYIYMCVSVRSTKCGCISLSLVIVVEEIPGKIFTSFMVTTFH